MLMWQKQLKVITIVINRPNSGSRSTTSASVKTNCGLRSFLQTSTMAICWAATESTGNSIRLNSSKQPHEPDCAKPTAQTINHILVLYILVSSRGGLVQWLTRCVTKLIDAGPGWVPLGDHPQTRAHLGMHPAIEVNSAWPSLSRRAQRVPAKPRV